MSAETYEWLNQNILIGFTDKRGQAWWYKKSLEGAEPNHYPMAIPVEDVLRRLFNWEAVESPIFYQVPSADGGELEFRCDDSRKLIYRSDNFAPLGSFKESYQGHSYKEWLLDTVSLILDDSLSIGSAGLLRNGAQAFVQVEVPDSIVTPEGVEFRPNLLACTSFDGTLASTFKRTITNVVCDNTMAAGLGEAGQSYKVKHSKYSSAKLTDAREALEIVHSMADDFAAEVAQLTNIEVSDKVWGKFLDALCPVPEEEGRGQTQAENKRADISSLWNGDPRVLPWKNTAYGVIQAVSTFEQHKAIVRGHDGTEEGKSALRAMRNTEKMVKGTYDELDRSTHEMLMALLPKKVAVAA
jgi:phage/plasmid-like protein (TIGR03299 family)